MFPQLLEDVLVSPVLTPILFWLIPTAIAFGMTKNEKTLPYATWVTALVFGASVISLSDASVGLQINLSTGSYAARLGATLVTVAIYIVPARLFWDGWQVTKLWQKIIAVILIPMGFVFAFLTITLIVTFMGLLGL